MSEEHVLSPVTVSLVERFEQGLEAFTVRGDQAAYEQLAVEVGYISDYDKGLAIIDLLVLLFTAMRSLQDHQMPKDPFEV